MASLSRSGRALRICSHISAEGCTSAGKWRQVSKCAAQRSHSQLSLPKSKSLVPTTQIQIHKTGKASISGKCVQAKGS
jgi:hypothetical protein